MAYKIVYDHDEQALTLVLPDGRRSDPVDLPDEGLGLVTVGSEMFVVVTPDHDGEANQLEHDTVYKLQAVPTEVEGDFPEAEDEVDEVVEGEDGEEEDAED